MLRLAQELQGVPMTYDAFRSLDEYRRVPLTRWTALQRLGDDSMLLNSAEWSEAVVARARAQKQPQVLADLADNQPTFRRALQLEQRRWETDRLTSYDGVIGEPELRQALESRYGLQGSTLSASQVEEYATCPLRYYLRYVLGLEPFEEPESVAELSPLDRGTLYHRILERFYRRCDEVGLFPLQTAQLERYTRLLDEAAAEEFEKAEREFNVGHPLMWQLQQEQARSDLTQFLQAELERGGSWRPTGFEVWFGNGSAAVSLEGADMEFRGRIDRIDVNRQETRARVTDYKTGSLRGYKKNRLQGGETIQLPVYVLAAAALLDLPPEAVIARYASVTAGAGFKEVLFEGEEWPRAAEELRRIVEVVDAGVRRGHFFAYPGPGAENCTYCDYSAVCTAGIETIAERKAEDPVQSDFHALKEEQQ
jgi:RecB family exonuclease